MKPLRLSIILTFLVSLVVSALYALKPGEASVGWFAAAAISALGLAWISWGDPGAPNDEARPLERPLRPTAARLASVDPPLVTRPGQSGTTASRDALFEEYFERGPVPLVVINREGHITRMNRAAEALTEFAAAEISSSPYWDVFLSGQEATEAASDYRNSMLNKQTPPRRESWRTRTGAQADFEWWRTVLSDDFGQSSGVLAAALPVPIDSDTVDVTALTDQLTAVNGYSEYLLMSMDEKDPLRNDLESIHRAAMAATSSLHSR